MIKLWAKIIKEHKIVKHYTFFDNAEIMDYSLFFEYISSICRTLDIATPVLLKTHIFNYAKFNYVVFKADDFIEHVEFDSLTIENADK